MEIIMQLEKQIFELKKQFKHSSVRYFSDHFVSLVKEKYPSIFEEIKKIIHEKVEK